MSALREEEIGEFIVSGGWETRFSASALDVGRALVGARLVKEARAEILDTGDAELTASVHDKSGGAFAPVVVLWREDGVIAMETECGCAARSDCAHAAALLHYLRKGKGKGKGERVERAFGGSPEAERMIGGGPLEATGDVGGTEERDSGGQSPPSPAPGDPEESTRPTFFLRVERRPEGPRGAWLPECFAEAHAVYEGNRVPLDPGGSLPPLVTPEKKIRRHRAAETEALQCLYALDLVPGAEEPPTSLRRLDLPERDGTLWAPDRKKWPHPEYYWQRFRHDGVAALERRNWEVRFAPGVGHKPLVFRAENWRAEIVEEGRGWFHLSAGFEIDGEEFDVQPILAALVKNGFLEATEDMPSGQEFLVFLPDGRGLVLPVGRFRRLLRTLGELLEFRFREGPIRLSGLDAALLAAGDASAGEEPIELSAPPAVHDVGERLRGFRRIERVEVPPGLRATLREYQLDGYSWLQFLVDSHLNGILADDMGLGKTLQSLAHILAEIESERSAGRPSLVIAPTSVVINWQREAEKFAPDLSVLVLQGAGRKRRFPRIRSADLVLTSFALLSRDIEELERHEFHLAIVDEAQHIKNPEAQVTQAACRLRAEHRVCLSGTPIENHLGELWSLMHFLMPGLLGSREMFRSTYQTPIEKEGSEARKEALVARVGPLILRRTKHEVARELPPKTEIVHPVEMTEEQKDLYETVRATMDKQVRQALAMRGQEARIVFLDALLKLRQICCHPALLPESAGWGGARGVSSSAKFDYLFDLIDTFHAEGHRILLFSQFTSMLSLIEARLQGSGISTLKLTGETGDRQDLVDRFQGGEGEVFLISLKAGGTGLNLTGADTVIHYDPWWNPAAENQATDRAYRIGQDKAVFVHKLICRGTVEERIQQMQEKKDSLADDLLSGASTGLDLTADSLAALLGEMEPGRGEE